MAPDGGEGPNLTTVSRIGEARRGQERPGEARRGQERPGEARRGQERPGEARASQGRAAEAMGRASQGNELARAQHRPWARNELGQDIGYEPKAMHLDRSGLRCIRI